MFRSPAKAHGSLFHYFISLDNEMVLNHEKYRDVSPHIIYSHKVSRLQNALKYPFFYTQIAQVLLHYACVAATICLQNMHTAGSSCMHWMLSWPPCWLLRLLTYLWHSRRWLKHGLPPVRRCSKTFNHAGFRAAQEMFRECSMAPPKVARKTDNEDDGASLREKMTNTRDVLDAFDDVAMD